MKKYFSKIIVFAIGLYFNTASWIFPKKIAEKAFRLFCTPQKGKITKGQKGFLEDAKDLILEDKDISIQTYCWKGSGPTILLMHGWESNSFRWRNFIPRLQKEDYNIIAMDAPAHGNSSGKLLNLPLYSSNAQKVIEAYNPKYIIGHSLGGMALLYSMYKHPIKNKGVEKLVTLGSPSELTDFMRQYKNILGLSKRMMALLENHFKKHFDAKFADFSSPRFAKNIAQQGLLIHDELDTVAPISSSQQVHASWNNSKLITTRGLGHSMHQDKVREEIVAFLKS